MRLSIDLLAEDAQQIVVERQVEAAEPRIALAPRTAAQLVVDAAAFVALGAEHEQPAGGAHRLAFGLHFGLDARHFGVAFRPRRQFGQLAS